MSRIVQKHTAKSQIKYFLYPLFCNVLVLWVKVQDRLYQKLFKVLEKYQNQLFFHEGFPDVFGQVNEVILFGMILLKNKLQRVIQILTLPNFVSFFYTGIALACVWADRNGSLEEKALLNKKNSCWNATWTSCFMKIQASVDD